MKQVLTLFCVLIFTLSMSSQGRRGTNIQETFEWPEGEWQNLSGNRDPFKLKDKLILIHFWDYDCSESIKTLGEMEDFYINYPEVIPVSVVTSSNKDALDLKVLLRELNALQITHPILLTQDTAYINSMITGPVPQVKFYKSSGIELRTLDRVLLNRPERFLNKYVNEYLVKENFSDYTISSPPPQISFAAEPHVKGLKDVDIDVENERMFVIDQGANRVLVTDFLGNVLDIIGSGMIGNATGSFEEASLNRPDGLSYDSSSGLLYISDTFNDEVKIADLGGRKVMSFMLQGKIAEAAKDPLFRKVLFKEIRYPSVMEISNGQMYLAFYGSSRIFNCDLRTNKPRIFELHDINLEGRKHEEYIRGNISGMTSDPEGNIYLIESEQNIIWKISPGVDAKAAVYLSSMKASGRAQWGYASGLQWTNKGIIISATSEHRLKLINDEGVSNFSGTGSKGFEEGKKGEGKYYFPASLAASEDDLFCVDLQNQVVRKINIKKRKTSSVSLTGAQPVRANAKEYRHFDSAVLPTVNLIDYELGQFTLYVMLPEELRIDTEQETWIDFGPNSDNYSLVGRDDTNGAYTFEIDAGPENQTMMIMLRIVLEEKDEPDVKYTIFSHVSIPFEFEDAKARTTELRIPVVVR